MTRSRFAAAIVAFLGATLGLASVCFSETSARFVASPMELHLHDGAGGRGNATINITNTGKQPLALKIYLGDSRLHPDGREEELPAGEHPRSCASWILLHHQVMELTPGESKRTGIDIEIPADAEGSYWTKIYIEETSVPEPTVREMEGRSYDVFMKLRLGIRVFEDVPGTGHLATQITRVSVREGEGGKPGVLVSVENSGTVIARCNGRVELHDGASAAVVTLPLGSRGEFWVYPGGSRDLVVTAPEPLGPGTYTALAIVDFGGDHLVAGDAVFRVTGDGIHPGDQVPEDGQ